MFFDIIHFNFYLHLYRPTDTLRHTVEVNRNICLLFGYILFIFVIDKEVVTNPQIPQLCTFITFLTYSVWIAFFLWTGKKIIV